MKPLNVSKRKVIVVGAGVIGLSCALELSIEYDVCLVAQEVGSSTDSRNATAIWHLYLVLDTPEVLWWAQRSFEVLYQIAKDSADAGVEMIEGVELFRGGSIQIPTWAHVSRLFEPLTEQKIAEYNALDDVCLAPAERELLRKRPVKWGYRIEVPAARMDTYLSWLERKALASGVLIERRRIASLEEVAAEAHAVVNCSGFGARELVDDVSFVAYKGQYFVLTSSPECPGAYVGDSDHPGGMTCVIPRLGEVVVGGCAEKGVEDLKLTLDWAETMSRASLYFPWLRQRTNADQARPPVVGLRPFRTSGVRLELDMTSYSAPVIHNYGHGGSGFTLAWGCAEAVRKLMLQI